MRVTKWLTIALLLAAAPAAHAHPGHDHAGLSPGVYHAISGIAAVLALIALGMWAGRRLLRCRRRNSDVLTERLLPVEGASK